MSPVKNCLVCGAAADAEAHACASCGSADWSAVSAPPSHVAPASSSSPSPSREKRTKS